MNRAFLALALAVLVGACACSTTGTGSRTVSPAPETAEKIRITRLDDLPRHSYEVSGDLKELVTSDEGFASLATEVREDVESILETYEIEDRATVRRLVGTLLTLDMLAGRNEEALARVTLIRELEEKPSAKLMAGLMTESLVEARRRVRSDTDLEAIAPVFRESFTRRVTALPWDVVQDDVESAKGRTEYLGEGLLLGIMESQLQPMVDQTGEVSREVAQQLISFRYALEVLLPLKEDVVYAYQKAVDAHRGEKKPDIWQARSVSLDPAALLDPVVVAIWDTGVDVDVFPGNMHVNFEERLNGEDTDGNGFVDDVFGIAYTLHHERTPELLYPLKEAAGRLPDMEANIKGFFDLRAAVESPEAAAVKQAMANLQPAEVQEFLEDLTRYTIYSHGTHVAGIAARGNPFARILVARLESDYHMVPEPPTVEDARKLVKELNETVAYFKAQGARVVNMSWVVMLTSIERDLELNGIGADAEERAALAREIFDILNAGLYGAIKGAPEILFVGGAGNFDDDVSFDEIIPPAFDLPNLIAAGAVDQAGDPTSFTSFGELVEVYSNGFEVDSFVPGGKRMEFSGTSMSAPNVTNLAAKLIALDPSLSPPQVIRLIKEGGDHTGADAALLLVNPRHSVELLMGS